MNKFSKVNPASWLPIVGVIIIGSAVFLQQHIRKANAATTNYPSATSATYTPDTLLW